MRRHSLSWEKRIDRPASSPGAGKAARHPLQDPGIYHFAEKPMLPRRCLRERNLRREREKGGMELPGAGASWRFN